jgi:biotin--protein ligase
VDKDKMVWTLTQQNSTFPDKAFYTALDKARHHVARTQQWQRGGWRFGNVVLHGERVTSTQTILDKNIVLSNYLPSGTVFIADQQISGRGRGDNAWVSSKGCLQFSMLLRHSIKHAPTPLFVQYILAVAIVDAVKNLPGYHNVPLYIKWPNDLYAAKDGQTTTPREALTKVGGILVTSSIYQDDFVLVVGCGLNVDNAEPTACLNQVIQAHDPHLPPLSQVELLASVLAWFDVHYMTFLRSFGFDALLPRYLAYWAHAQQIVHVQDKRVKLIGLDEHGMLLTAVVDNQQMETGERLTLQPDGNTFDMLHNMIRRK